MMRLGARVGLLVALSLASSSKVCSAWSSAQSRSRLSSRLFSSGNNVVLRPSTDPERFDSCKIGTARVHRYIRDSFSSPDEADAEYVMWYTARAEGFDSEQKLAPLSTGRIGRATSRNGLVWKKVVEGSLSEDKPDVSLGLNKESWWGFDTAHVGLGQVLLPMTTPAVMTEGGVYLMYYMGGSYDEESAQNYMETPTDATVQGMKLKIGVAISQDGVSWGRVEGDDHTGACMIPYDETDPNFEPIRDDNDKIMVVEEELYCGWPEVVINQVSEGEEGKSGFIMFYSTMTKEDKVKALAYAVSEDGFRFEKRGVCLRPDASGPDSGGCARCNVIRKASYNEDTGVWSDANGWMMFYEGVSNEDGKHRIMSAESDDDGVSWKKTGVAIQVGEEGAWDCNGAGSPHVLRLDDGAMRMYYTGQAADGSTAIGVARSVPDVNGGAWAREQAEFTFA
uniref:Arabinan endo-1,5-alpha-L-arabinosidase n=1 Tax=Attheya septentrionalis TaxID=420275 RepID=A0A7S2UMK2_9STRA|mmetsp:Transcript_29401/g.53852  ORF Transcript_29401/g.53852 Transcript_29401/m.53852 type:complete len:451 (+) Transcript_29401:50-1402(+)